MDYKNALRGILAILAVSGGVLLFPNTAFADEASDADSAAAATDTIPVATSTVPLATDVTDNTPNGWVQTESGRQYYQDGQLRIGVFSVDNVLYRSDENGIQQTGWQTIDGARHYYNPETGEAAIGVQEIDGVYRLFDFTGAQKTGWRTVNGIRQYFDPETGDPISGWIDYDGKRYYSDPETGKQSGEIATGKGVYVLDEEYGWQHTGFCTMSDGDVYYYDESDYEPITGWLNSNGLHYYFQDDCAMTIGWGTIDNNRYYFSTGGIMSTGWRTVDGKRYYFDKNGVMQSGWKYVSGSKYYFGSDGAMQTGWQSIDSGTYYLDENGVMQTGWATVENDTYYLTESGGICKGESTVDGKRYLFDTSTGALQRSKTVNGVTTDANGIIIKRILSVPYISQSGFPTGCESASAVMLLHQAGYSTSLADFIDYYLDTGSITWSNGIMYAPDPNQQFVGDPRSSGGFGCYAPVITNALNRVLSGNRTAKNITGTAFSKLLTDYIDKGTPVAVWASINMMEIDYGRQWIIPETGEWYTWKRHEHCLVLVGYDSEYYYMNDPYQSKGLVAYSRSVVEARYATMGYQAVVIV